MSHSSRINFPTNNIFLIKPFIITLVMELVQCTSDEMSQVAVIAVTLTMLSLAHRVLMVLGAGRGPLVNASLRAARQADRKLRVYAVEKNPNAIIT